jgi:hypothetical protein
MSILNCCEQSNIDCGLLKMNQLALPQAFLQIKPIREFGLNGAVA